MNPLCSIWFPGHVVGKGRARFVRSTGRAYTPEKTVNYEAYLRHCMASAWKRPPLDGPVAVSIEIKTAIPASWSQKRKAAALDRPASCKPDLDNVLKALADSGNGVLWADDKQITDVTVRRVYAEEPGLFLAISAAVSLPERT